MIYHMQYTYSIHKKHAHKRNRNYLVGLAWRALGKLPLRCERASCPPTPLLLHGAGAIKVQLRLY